MSKQRKKLVGNIDQLCDVDRVDMLKNSWSWL